MDLAQLLAWIVGANTVVNFATTAYTLMSARATKALEGIKALDTKISALSEERQRASDAVSERFQKVESRLLKIESDMEHMPDREQAQALALAIEKLSGRVGILDERLTGRIETLSERLNPVQAMAARLQDLEFERDK
ncbi:MAG: hypothetical protein EOS63_17410 [Mesorhizobium sp.]|uniref:hypothetical protein n=1 Tax=Mesorhizobium sp. TaxID=1871066 RepID=UPI000FE94A70|nr:hypothetical protein [Mesorhizobium sp.]RWB50858.1 MAG: hypothetical protein EOQ47_31910 [Mesorhizobium sp.]RWE78532.1 MAG: hypothetical protein EOS63_17410 [Mesorhizobium sp.]TJW61018.1 MAG: iron-containing alcohol dehydrogenase [Mesorhizobium sp.]